MFLHPIMFKIEIEPRVDNSRITVTFFLIESSKGGNEQFLMCDID